MDIQRITQEQARELIKKLSQEIKEYNIAYYQENAPKISDAEYDQLFFTLKNLEEEFPEYLTDDSPTQNVGSHILDKFEKHEHKTPMLSLATEPKDTYIQMIFLKYFANPKLMGFLFLRPI